MTIVNAGGQTHYLYGLVTGLAPIAALQLEVVDSAKAEGLFDGYKNVAFFNLRGDQNPESSYFAKSVRLLAYYCRLIIYAASTRSQVFHIQWLNRFTLFDRTLLILYYRLLRKRLVFTAHNVNQARRDGKPSFLETLSLRMMYRLVHSIIAHTHRMKRELIEEFQVREDKIEVIPHGINNIVVNSGMSQDAARAQLGIEKNKKVILFFGRIDKYKGLELLVEAFSLISAEAHDYFLVIAGNPKNCPDYVAEIKRLVEERGGSDISIRFEHIPDAEIEAYFSAADCLVLPYRTIFQSGVLFLSFAYGLPVIATDVGNFREDIVKGFNGFVCRPDSPSSLADTLREYFRSGLYRDLGENRFRILEDAREKYSWLSIGRATSAVYERLANPIPGAGSGRHDRSTLSRAHQGN